MLTDESRARPRGSESHAGPRGATPGGPARVPLPVIPAVDLLGDRAVRLERGDYSRRVGVSRDPLALVGRFAAAGAGLIHVVDLNGARSGRLRIGLIAEVIEAAGATLVQASGGVRSPDDAAALLDAGVARVVIGTAAFARPPGLDDFRALRDRLVVAIDCRDDHVAVRGWRQTTNITVEDAARRAEDAGATRLLCTAINRDGTLAGPDLRLLARLAAATRLRLIAAGGIRGPGDLAAVAAAGAEAAIAGRALLEGSLPLSVLRHLPAAGADGSP